jgi:hypothetical protein
LSQAVGGKIRIMTGDPTQCICPAPEIAHYRILRIRIRN